MPRLQWVDGDGEILALAERPVLVGKDASCIVRPKRVRCAPRHARIFFREGVHVIEALAPDEPVFVNGTTVKEHTLEHGDDIVCGQLRLTYWNDEGKARPR